MPKKRQPFICFVHAMRGTDPSNNGLSLPELVSKYGETWKNMSAEDRKPYEDESKGVRVNRPVCTSRGRNVSVEDEETRAANQFEEYLRQLVVSVVFENQNIEDLKNKSFFFASFNVMVRTREDNKYYPNEIGIVEYSIAKGIINNYHEFIDPGDVPMGYARIAKEHSEQFHKIPTSQFAQARGNQRHDDGTRNLKARDDEMANLILEITQMLDGSKLKSKLEANEDKFIVFCSENQIEQVKGCFKFLCEQTKEFAEISERFIVLDVTRLLMTLMSRIGTKRPYGICEGDLNRSTYNYSANTNCAFHDEMDTYYCALGVAKRYCYMLSDVLCDAYKVKATDNHYPPESATNFEVKDVVGFDFDRKPISKRYFKADREERECSNQVSTNIRAPREFPSGTDVGTTASATAPKTIKQENSASNYVLGIGRGRGLRVPQQKPNF